MFGTYTVMIWFENLDIRSRYIELTYGAISNRKQETVGCNYLCMAHIPTSDFKLLKYSGLFNIEMPYYQYRNHCGYKTIIHPFYLHNGISCTGNMTSLYWIRTQMLWASCTQAYVITLNVLNIFCWLISTPHQRLSSKYEKFVIFGGYVLMLLV